MTRSSMVETIFTLSEEQLNRLSEFMQAFIQENKEKEQSKEKRVLKARGIGREHANPDLIPFEKGAWERAVVEKYGERNK